MKIYADENIELSVIEGLRRRKVTVLSAIDLGYSGKSDEFHLAKASDLQAVILTHDVDFLMMASRPGIKH
jgi:predicted nuclease of predicted toxin-antitoxin system